MGDPAGVGPEVLARAWASGRLPALCEPLIVGDPAVMRRALALCGSVASVATVGDPAAVLASSPALPVWPGHGAGLGVFADGRPQAPCGEAAYGWIRDSIDLALRGIVQAVVTGPVSKQAIEMAGHRFSGHTELFAELTGVTDVRLMLVDGPRRVVHVTGHLGLAEAVARLDCAGVERTLALGADACRALGVPRPRLAICGLNPHAGEGGRFGDEETRILTPAIAAARTRGLAVSDPLPPDTAFVRAFSGEFDLVVAMVHDHGHIPFKLACFQAAGGRMTAMRGVNVTLGLPIVRTSVDHGTAWDIAWKGVALDGSLLDAVELAVQLAVPPPP